MNDDNYHLISRASVTPPWLIVACADIDPVLTGVLSFQRKPEIQKLGFYTCETSNFKIMAQFF